MIETSILDSLIGNIGNYYNTANDTDLISQLYDIDLTSLV